MNIAYFGLGNMGFPIAANLLKASYTVKSAAHRSKERLEKFAALGGIACASNEEAVRDADIIFTIVPHDAALRELMLAPAMMDAVKEGAVIIDMTSASAQIVQELADAYAAKGVGVLDAPVSGGVKGAAAATITMMCAGERAVFDKVLPVLKSISKTQFYCGEKPGLGKMIKSLNNLMAAATLALTGEVVKIVKKNGIDPETFYDVVCTSSGCSVSFSNKFKQIVDEDFAPRFAAALMKKDVGLAMQLAEGLDVPMAQLTQAYFDAAAEQLPDEDYAAVYKIRL